MAEEEPVSWRSIVYGTPVNTSDGKPAGTVREVLGDDAEDIFHGLRVELEAGKRNVVVSAEDIASMSRDAVRVDLTADQLAGQAEYDETKTYHVSSVGRFRKHLGWKQDSASDEEPG